MRKKYEVSFLVDKDSPCYAENKDYGVIIETSLLDNFGENGSMSDCDELYVDEMPKDESGTVDIVMDFLNKFSKYEDLSLEYQRLTYIPGKSKNAENIEKWCKDNNRCLVCYKAIRGPETMNIIVTSNWFGKVISDWKKGKVLHTKTHGKGTILSDEPFACTGDLCVNVDFGGYRDTFECWKLLADIDKDTVYKVVKERNQQELYNNYTFWDVVEYINWEWLSKNIKHPHNRARELLIGLGYDDHRISDLGDTATAFRKILQNRIREYSLKVTGKRYGFTGQSDDGFWDLTAHIVGLGEKIYNEVMANPEKIKNWIPGYVENFEYCFSVSCDSHNPNNIEHEYAGVPEDVPDKTLGTWVHVEN